MRNKQNTQVAISLLMLLLSMLILSFAAVPIYNIFCKVTGFGGTVQENVTGSLIKGHRTITVRFDANVDKNLPWDFKPKQKQVTITSGENNLIFYQAKNNSNNNIIGTAVYNVTPNKAGVYFNKIHCFCFEEQLLKAGQDVLMPVSFFIDAKFDSDPNMSDVDTITLSYSFFKVRELEINN